MAAPPFREVIREHRFERELRHLIRENRAADDFVSAAEIVLAHNPEIGSQVSEKVWFLPMSSIGDAQVSLYYTFDESTVWLLSIARV